MLKTNNSRRFPGESSKHRPDFADLRRKEAKERQEAYDKLSIKEKIEKLDLKFGKDQGAAKVRSKLQAQMSEKTNSTVKQNISDEVLQEIEQMNQPSKKRSKKNKSNDGQD